MRTWGHVQWVKLFSVAGAQALLISTLLCSCVESALVPCGEQLCPQGTVCTAAGCVTATDLAACGDKSDGTSCQAQAGQGLCLQGRCVTVNCGDGIVSPAEACDDGNNASGDGCSANCASNETCGNHQLDAISGESCDDGNQLDDDECRNNCQLPRCGDGVVDTKQGESCDAGANNSNAPDAACRSNCQVKRCGDGVRDAGEACDDLNIVSGDGCSGDCLSTETCGNGYIDIARDEECDDGNIDDADQCHTSCLIPRCGDGIADAQNGEGCDAGSANSDEANAACRTNCQPQRCGDGIRDAAEACDDGNVVAGDGCSSDCRSNETCGNGVVDALKGEQCDDLLPKGLSGDGCSSTCRVEVLSWTINANTNAQPFLAVFDTTRNRAVLFNGHTIEFDGASWRPQNLARNLPTDTYGAAVAYDSQRKRVVLFRSSTLATQSETWEYDGVNWQLRQPTTAPSQRNRAAMVYDTARQRIVLFGGGWDTPTPRVFNETWEWDGVDWTKRTLATAPAAREAAAMVFDSTRNRTVLFSGRTNRDIQAPTLVADTWEYDGTTWRRIATAARPPVRTDAGIAFDSVRNRVVLTGGLNMNAGGSLFDTWEYTGTNWVAKPAAPTSNRTMYFDKARAKIMVVDGLPLNELFEYDGTSWTARMISPAAPVGGTRVFIGNRTWSLGGADMVSWQPLAAVWFHDGEGWQDLSPGTSFPARIDPAAAFDSTRNRIVMFGGFGINGELNDTWTFDTLTWRRIITATSPNARSRALMAYDSVRQRMVLVGGFANGALSNDTWEFDGTTWTQRASTNLPPTNMLQALAYDPLLQRTVMVTGSPELLTTWLWDGNQWTVLATAAITHQGFSLALVYDRFAKRIKAIMNEVLEFDGIVWRNAGVVNTHASLNETPYGYDDMRNLIHTPNHPAAPRETLGLRSLFVPQEGCWAATDDDDGDGLAGCADPDCAYRCAPSCSPYLGCVVDANTPRCGDGICDTTADHEDFMICPADCMMP